MSVSGLRASDADRDKVVEVLHTAYAEGRIDSEEHTERVEKAIRAKTFDELLPLTADLIPSATKDHSAHRPSTIPAVVSADKPDRFMAALSEVKRAGDWRVHRRSDANVFMGSVQLDLTQATFDAPVVEINVTQFLGSVFLRVPCGFTVRDETATVLGETSIKGIGEPDPSFPTIVIRGTNVLGEIKVRGPKRPLSWRKALT